MGEKIRDNGQACRLRFFVYLRYRLPQVHLKMILVIVYALHHSLSWGPLGGHQEPEALKDSRHGTSHETRSVPKAFMGSVWVVYAKMFYGVADNEGS